MPKNMYEVYEAIRGYWVLQSDDEFERQAYFDECKEQWLAGLTPDEYREWDNERLVRLAEANRQGHEEMLAAGYNPDRHTYRKGVLMMLKAKAAERGGDPAIVDEFMNNVRLPSEEQELSNEEYDMFEGPLDEEDMKCELEHPIEKVEMYISMIIHALERSTNWNKSIEHKVAMEDFWKFVQRLRADYGVKDYEQMTSEE